VGIPEREVWQMTADELRRAIRAAVWRLRREDEMSYYRTLNAVGTVLYGREWQPVWPGDEPDRERIRRVLDEAIARKRHG